ncbi:MAG: SpoIID/LytB domain-containing protein [Candidatus Marinimicrobia bacterium]|nr:SpoIID/LytB domain-containing protein [Candidatus Neomarinimicrobiota bacterium]
MLKPDTIPNKEPNIRVGIILPEDKQKKVSINIPIKGSYKIEIDGKKATIEKEEININIKENRLFCEIDTDKYENCDQIKFKKLIEEAYVVVKPVIAGRVFHWKKQIEVKLPDTVEITISDGNLLLVNELPLEDYLMCVATSEMGAKCPTALIEAQTVVARSWMLANVEKKHIELGIDVCNDDCCQRYQGMNNLTEHSKKGTENTRGKVIMYDNKICDARYSKSCGGMMEKFENLWENTPLPYMQNIPDMPKESSVDIDLTREENAKKWILSSPKAFCSPHTIDESELKKYLGNVDEEGKYYRWEEEITQEELVKNLNEKLDLNVKEVLQLIPKKRAGSGRMLELEVEYKDINDKIKSKIIYKDYDVRLVLHPKFLFSSAIVITYKKNSYGTIDKFIYNGAGWGHGAGMCQIGALGMSLKGYSVEEILLHYYPNSVYKKIYN